MLRGIYCRDNLDIGMETVQIINPIEIRGISNREKIDINADGVTVKDEANITSMNIHNNTKLLARVHSNITNEGAKSKVTIFLGMKKIINFLLRLQILQNMD